MNKEKFFNLIYLYIKNQDTATKMEIISIAEKHPMWLITPTSDKSIWNTCAKILIELKYEIIKKNLPHILEYYQDINWPGADVITRYLTNIPKEDLIVAITEVLPLAANDDFWLFGLVSLMVATDTIKVFQSIDKYNKLIKKSDYF